MDRRTFLEQYAIIRHAEGRGSDDPAYYRALPYRDLSGKSQKTPSKPHQVSHFGVFEPIITTSKRFYLAVGVSGRHQKNMKALSEAERITEK